MLESLGHVTLLEQHVAKARVQLPAVRSHALGLQELTHRLVNPSLASEKDSQIVPRIDELRLQPHGSREMTDRVLGLPLPSEQHPEVVVSLRQIGLHLDCGGEMDLRFFETPFLEENVAQTVVYEPVPGRDIERVRE